MPILHQQTRIVALMTLCAVISMLGGVWADSKQGAYAGLGINFAETTAINNKNVITKGSAKGTGGYAGVSL
ncbi:MAG: hypothetical protein OSB34_12575 [Planktomarina sp.]|nr:hypothetical protein [Planktomarina sp.]